MNHEIVLECLNNMEDGKIIISNLGLTTLPESELWKEVTHLECSSNLLVSLPDLPLIRVLRCSRNQLISLPNLPLVNELRCSYNRLNMLPVLPNVIHLSCYIIN